MNLKFLNMDFPLQKIKELLKAFIDERSKGADASSQKKMFSTDHQKDILELDLYWLGLKQKSGFNDQVDASIKGLNISSGNFFVTRPFRPIHYQYNFLLYLALNYADYKSLYDYIDGFLVEYAGQLSLADIKKTASGATRCKTNIRFALNALRDIYLVSNGINNKRSWRPTLIGVLVLLNIHYFKLPEEKIAFYRESGALGSLKIDYGNLKYDPFLTETIFQLKDAYNLYVLLTKGEQNCLTAEEKDYLEKMVADYINFISDALIITPGGVNESKEFRKKSKEFIESRKLDSIGFDIFKKLIGRIPKKESTS